MLNYVYWIPKDVFYFNILIQYLLIYIYIRHMGWSNCVLNSWVQEIFKDLNIL